MRRPLVTSTLALMLAVAPSALFAQEPPTQPPAAAQPAQPEAPKPPQVAFTTPAGILLVQIKPAETAAFEEMAAKIRASIAKAQDPALQQQGAGMKIYKSSEEMAGNALYIISIDPVVPGAEYEPFAMIVKGMSEEEQRDPATTAMWERFRNAFAAGMSKLSLTPIGGGM